MIACGSDYCLHCDVDGDGDCPWIAKFFNLGAKHMSTEQQQAARNIKKYFADARHAIEMLIMYTPTGADRDRLTDANMQVMQAEKNWKEAQA